MASERLDIVVTERGAKTVSRDIRNVGKSGKQAATGVDTLKKALFLIGGFAVARRIIGLADTFALLQNQINVVSESTSDLASNTKRLFDISNRTRTAIAQNVQLFQRLSFAAKDLGFSQKELFTFVEQTGKLLAIQGGSAAAARGALVQLTQAMGSSIVRAEEFNSILEGAFTIAQAAAKGIDRAGGSVSKLRTLIIKGLVTSKEFAEAVLSQAAATEEAFARTTATIGQSFNILENKATEFFGQLGKDTGITERLAVVVQLLAENLEGLATVLGVVASVILVKLVAVAIPALVAGLTAVAVTVLPLIAGAALAAFGFMAAVAVTNGQTISEVFDAIKEKAGGIFTGIAASFTGSAAKINKFQAAIFDFSFTLAEMGGASGVAKDKIDGLLKTLNDLRSEVNQALLVQKLIDPASNAVRELGSQLITVDALIKKISDRTFNKVKPIPTGKGAITELSKKDVTAFKSLRDQLDPLGASFRSTAEDQALLDKALKLGKITMGEYGTLADGLAKRSLKEVNDAMDELNPAFARQKDLLEEIKAPAVDYAQTMGDLTALLNAGSISLEQFNKKQVETRLALLETQTTAAAGAERAFLKINRDMSDFASQTEEVITNAFETASSAIEKFVETGKFSFSDLANSIASDLLKLGSKQLVAGLIGGESGGGFGGMLTSLLNSGNKSSSGGGGNFLADIFQGAFANGGGFTVGGNNSTALGGGVDNRLVAFRARDGEDVTITPRGKAAGGGGDVSVQFNFPPGTDVDSFRRSTGQVAARTQAVLQRASRRDN